MTRNNALVFAVSEVDVGKRADIVIVSRRPDLSRSIVQNLFRERRVLINGSWFKPSARVNLGDTVEVEIVIPPAISAEPQLIPLTIVYQDGDLAIIDKPAGLVVHPAPGNRSGTLANALTALFPQTRGVGSDLRPGIVHRLDKDTSGLMVVALTTHAHASLQAQISSRTAGRGYLALVEGHVKPDRGTIDAPIGRDSQNRKRMAVYGLGSRPARTSFEVHEVLTQYTYLEATLHTGRTHQIRVHLAAAGHPVVGDVRYHGRAYPGLDRHFLHAHRLTLQSPSTGTSLNFTSPLPSELDRVINEVRMLR